MDKADDIRFYQGRSMAGTFQPGDCLTVVYIEFEQVRLGDVVVFRKHGQEEEIAHRVIGILDTGLATRGDNNRQVDPEPVTGQNLIGRVVACERGGKVRPVVNGRVGLLQARLKRSIRRASYLLRRIGGGPYRWLRRSRLVARFWKPKFTRIRLETAHGKVVKYLYRKRTVAVWQAYNNSYEVRKPYDLVFHRTKPPESD
jgi:signal peptidase I